MIPDRGVSPALPGNARETRRRLGWDESANSKEKQ
jgi:hypothetical protein